MMTRVAVPAILLTYALICASPTALHARPVPEGSPHPATYVITDAFFDSSCVVGGQTYLTYQFLVL